MLASLTNISEHQNFDFNLIQTCWDTMIKINCKNKNHIFTIISRNLKIDWALFTAAFIRMRFKFECGLYSNAVFIRMRLTFEHDKLYSLKKLLATFCCGLYSNASYIWERLTIVKLQYCASKSKNKVGQLSNSKCAL